MEAIRCRAPLRRVLSGRVRSSRRSRAGRILAAVVVGCFGVALAVPPASAAPPTPIGRLLFSEEFNGPRLDGNRWNKCYWWSTHGCTNLSNNELQWYLPEQVNQANGRLRLVAQPRTVSGIGGRRFDFVSGLVSNLTPDDSLFSFTYGYVEAQARIPEGPGLWSALWMLPTSRESEPEVDIFEVLGQRPRVAEMHVHWQQGRRDRSRGFGWRSPTNLAKGWHTYGLYWSPDALIWYIDGAPRWYTVRTKRIPDEPMYLVANLAVGGGHAGPPTLATPFPAVLRFDYIRVWALP
jgi:beta-glucanase (GH16 family)